MAEWLESNLFRGWFWKEIGNNLWNFDYLGWLGNAPIIVKAVFGITVGLFGWLYVVSYFPQSKPILRWTGVAFQLVGFILAAYGLEKTLKEFGRTPSTSRIIPWFRELLNIFDTSREATVVIQGAPARLTMRGGTGELKSEGLSLPERVDRLETRIDQLESEIQSRIDDEVERLESKIEVEVEGVEQDVEEMRETMKEVNVGEGALWMGWSGVSFFVYGVPLASFPSLFQPATRVLIVPVVAGTLLGSLHWYAD